MIALEIAGKVALVLAMIAPAHHAPGHALPIRQGVRAVPATSPSPAPVGIYAPAGVLTAEQVAGYVRRAGFPSSLVATMVSIIFRESGGDPHAVNPSSGACGLTQLYPCPGSSALDPMTNLFYAREKCLADVAAGYSCLRPWGG